MDGVAWVRALLVAFPVLKLLTHLSTGDGYGYHRDEFYYLACARHLDWGYVDHPPFSVLVLRLFSAVFGEGVRAIRVVPALAGAATVFLVGLLARRLGGGVLAVTLAMVAALVAPVYLSLDHYFSMNALDLLVWCLSAYLFVSVLRGGPAVTWPLLGAVLGIGLQNKLSVLWLIFGLGLGLLLTPQRRLLRTRGPWLAIAIALLVFLPHVVWQAQHGWPTLEFIHNATQHKLVEKSIARFTLETIAGMLIFAAPVWMAGLAFYLFLPAGRDVRALGWAFLAVFSVLALSKTSRDYYLAAGYTWLLGAGGVAIEGWLGRLGRLGPWAGSAFIGFLLLLGRLVAPVVLPILPQEEAVQYVRGLGGPRAQERSGIGPLPEFLAHMSGWEEIVATVAEAHAGLPAEERPRATILVVNYGVAGAIDRLGSRYSLPAASSGHNNYWLWGPRGSGDPTIVVGRTEAELQQWFAEVTRVGTTQCSYCMPYESGQPVWVARRPRAALAELWPQFKHFD
ncbi:MAG TPA: glycosyltransferase family 39 protein [Vicinamibacteria bacterium]